MIIYIYIYNSETHCSLLTLLLLISRFVAVYSLNLYKQINKVHKICKSGDLEHFLH